MQLNAGVIEIVSCLEWATMPYVLHVKKSTAVVFPPLSASRSYLAAFIRWQLTLILCTCSRSLVTLIDYSQSLEQTQTQFSLLAVSRIYAPGLCRLGVL